MTTITRSELEALVIAADAYCKVSADVDATVVEQWNARQALIGLATTSAVALLARFAVQALDLCGATELSEVQK